jgi:hypothetical protein
MSNDQNGGGGYKKPPPDRQFGAANGNPRYRGGSRKAKPPSFPSSFDKLLAKKVRVKEGGVERETKLFDGVLMRIGVDALAGKPGATAMFLQLYKDRQSLDAVAAGTSENSVGDLEIIEAYLRGRGPAGDDDAQS